MTGRFILYLLTCGPFLRITLAAWMKLYWTPKQQKAYALALLALGVATASATLSIATFLFYELKPPSHFLPPWQDPEILQLGLLSVLAPIGMILGVIAGVQGARKWLVSIIEIASLLLLVMGLMAGSAV